MPNTDDPETFEERWDQHVTELTRLIHTLPQDEHQRLSDATDELHELVEIAADEMRDADEQ